MKSVEIIVNNQNENDLSIDDIKISGFSKLDCTRFGMFLADMMGADQLVMHEINKDGDGIVTYAIE